MPKRLLLPLLALTGGLLVAVPPAATGTALAPASVVPGNLPAPPSGRGTTVQLGPHYAVITFRKNHRNALRSRLVWRVLEARPGADPVVTEQSWRAGSGDSPHATDPCRSSNGWLPDGTYQPRLYADYPGSIVKGRAVYLGQRACHDGTVRRNLFIHTEQGPGSHQCRNVGGDQSCRWEYPSYDDYRSIGCIKVSPRALHQLSDDWRRFTRSSLTPRVRLVVR